MVEKFLHLNKLNHISRAHQLCMEGYQELFRNSFSTVWSAPNYCHRFGNLAAVMAVDENLQVCIFFSFSYMFILFVATHKLTFFI